ncbi:MAG: DUF2273 domain-containing protein [Clostridiales bacterium]|nr:DUF2273 domain-containing protein [Clostridiales bacterium]
METRENEREVRLNALTYRRIAGALVGVAAAVLMLLIGFWKALLVIVLGALGWWIGGGCYLPMFVLRWISNLLNKRRERAE